MSWKSGKEVVVEAVEGVGARVRFIGLFILQFTKISTGGGEKSPGGGTPNSKSNSNAGGKTVSGSGVRPNYGGGRYYGGGATVPYTAAAWFSI